MRVSEQALVGGGFVGLRNGPSAWHAPSACGRGPIMAREQGSEHLSHNRWVCEHSCYRTGLLLEGFTFRARQKSPEGPAKGT